MEKKKLIARRNQHFKNWKLLSSDKKGDSRDYIKMVEVEYLLSSFFGEDKFTLIESRTMEI
jgi:hypothetical protein